MRENKKINNETQNSSTLVPAWAAEEVDRRVGAGALRWKSTELLPAESAKAGPTTDSEKNNSTQLNKTD
jgi:hypothetical protein